MSDHHSRQPSRDQRDPQTRNLRSRSSSRDMSWRKPVPKFTPSPPVSPNHPQSAQHTSPPSAFTFEYPADRTNPFSTSVTSLKNDLPPLPTDWRENIDRVIRNESSTNLKSLRTPPISPVATSPTRGFMHGHYHNPAVSQSRIPEADTGKYVFQEVDLGERRPRDYLHSADKENIPPPGVGHGLKRLAISPGANESTVSIARTPKTYRPPTPPLPSRKRSSAPPTPITTTMNKPMHIIYPDLAGLGVETRNPRTKSPESDDTVDTYTLRTVHSSLTAWTSGNTRGASTDTSTLADDDDRTLPVNQAHSVRKSTAASETMLVAELHDSGPGSRGAFGLLFDAFLGPFKSCLPSY